MKTITGGVKMPRRADSDVRLQTASVTPEVGMIINVFPDENHDAFSHVTVEAVTAEIDANITPENIRKNINILGCVGNFGGDYQEKSVTPSGSQQTVTPDNGYFGLSKVYVSTAPMVHLTTFPETSDKTVVPGTGFAALSALTLEPVTAAIDPDIKPENIKEGVTVLGVTGTLKGGKNLYGPWFGDYISASNIVKIIRSIELPAGITRIGDQAFNGAGNILNYIALPDTVTSIGRAAFAGVSIMRIYIPASVTSIEYAAFNSCGQLHKGGVYYGGTQEQWNAITIDNTSNGNSLLIGAPKYYNCTGLPD